MEISIKPVNFESDTELVRELFKEYESVIGFSLDFQNFADELLNLQKMYSPPKGNIFLAYAENNPLACVAIRKLEEEICEMKRLYVKPEFRNFGIGKSLTQKSLEYARSLGYKVMRLDTVSEMKEAISIYKKYGFYEIPPYRYNPFPDAVFMEKIL